MEVNLIASNLQDEACKGPSSIDRSSIEAIFYTLIRISNAVGRALSNPDDCQRFRALVDARALADVLELGDDVVHSS